MQLVFVMSDQHFILQTMACILQSHTAAHNVSSLCLTSVRQTLQTKLIDLGFNVYINTNGISVNCKLTKSFTSLLLFIALWGAQTRLTASGTRMQAVEQPLDSPSY